MNGQQVESILKLALIALFVVGFVGCLSGCYPRPGQHFDYTPRTVNADLA